MTRRRPLHLALCITAVVATALSCARTATRPTLPETPAGQALRAWLDAYNASDSARLDAYARQFDPTMSVHTQLVLRQQSGRWELASVERSEPRHLEVTLRSRAESTTIRRPLTMYGVVDVVDAATSTPARVTTSLVLVGTDQSTTLSSVDARQREVALDSLIAKVVRNYVLPDVAQRIGDSLRARRSRGAYDDRTDAIGLAHRLDRELQTLGADKQLGVEYAWRLPLPPPPLLPPAMLHCGHDPATLLADSVGYVRFYSFAELNMDCGHAIKVAMNAVAGARALILDLREHEDESRARLPFLAAYLVDGCTRLADVWDRRTGETRPQWTEDGVPGPALGGMKPLYILTSARTFAAGEALAYDLQRLGRATVVGERTGGGAHITAIGPIGEHLLVHVPVARAVNPITKTNWQGVGVVPDVPVPASDALAAAQRLIREKHGARTAAAAPVATPPDVWRAHGAAAPTQPMPGIRFAIDTLGPLPDGRGVLSRVAGIMEFAAGRGRLDVTAVRHAPVVSVDSVIIGEPLARAGDYYLFDNTGFILVRPAARTFSSFTFARASFNLTGALLPGAFLMRPTPNRMDTLAVGDGRRQHAPVSIHWHMQPRGERGLEHLYARGWLEIKDAPAVEADVARWFEVAAALATRSGGVSSLAPGGVEVTSIALLRRPGAHVPSVTYLEMLTPRELAAVDVEPRRLVLPAGYRETPWPGLDHEMRLPAPARTAAARWRSLEDISHQYGRATCRPAWLPDLSDSTR